MKRTCVLIFALFLACGLMHANSLSFDLNWIFSPGTGSATNSFGTATFEDTGTDTVKLTMTSVPSVGNWFITGWYFNFNFAGITSPLSISRVDPNLNPPSAATIGTSGGFKADGDGTFDLYFGYPTAANAPGRFGPDMTDVYTFSGTGLSVEDFAIPGSNPLSPLLSRDKDGARTGLPVAAHVQGFNFGGNNSVWVTDNPDGGGFGDPVPEPVTFVLVGMVLVAAGLTRRFRGRRSNNPAAHL